MATNYSGNSTPTLNNAPASSWTDDAAKHSHVGNTYLVTGSGGTAGNVYSFEEYSEPLIKSASGLPTDIVTITDGGENLNMVNAEVTLSPIQSLNGYDHPWAGGAGKNLIDCQVTGDGTVNSPSTLLAPGTYYVYVACSTTAFNCPAQISSDNSSFSNIGTTETTTAYANQSMSVYFQHKCIVTVVNPTYFRIRVQGNSATEGKLVRGLVTADSTNYSSIPNNFVDGNQYFEAIWSPYSNLCPITGHTQATLNIGTEYPTPVNTFTLSLGQTVYGGKIDLVTGEGQSKLATAVFDGTDSSGWTRTAAYGSVTRFDKSVSGLKPGSGANLKCNQFPVGTIGTANLACCNVHGNSPVLQIQIPTSLLSSDNVSGLMTYFSANNLQIVYELASPVSLSLTGQQIQTLLGTNVVWGDGEVSQLVYRSNQFTPSYDWFENWTMPKITRDNGSVIVLPYPQEYTPEIYDVDAATTGRNAAGTMIRDRVARKHKFNYKFPPLSRADATEILNAVQDVSFTLTTASPETGAKTNYRVYVGDRSLPVYWMPTHDNASWLYSSLSLNLIEM